MPGLQGREHTPMQSQCSVSRKNNENVSISQTQCPVHSSLLWFRVLSPELLEVIRGVSCTLHRKGQQGLGRSHSCSRKPVGITEIVAFRDKGTIRMDSVTF